LAGDEIQNKFGVPELEFPIASMISLIYEEEQRQTQSERTIDSIYVDINYHNPQSLACLSVMGFHLLTENGQIGQQWYKWINDEKADAVPPGSSSKQSPHSSTRHYLTLTYCKALVEFQHWSLIE